MGITQPIGVKSYAFSPFVAMSTAGCTSLYASTRSVGVKSDIHSPLKKTYCNNSTISSTEKDENGKRPFMVTLCCSILSGRLPNTFLNDRGRRDSKTYNLRLR